MDEVVLILKAYWEQLHDRLVENKDRLSAEIKELLNSEIEKQNFPRFDTAQFAAYLEAALAFIEERIEAYNPLGLQYLFDAQSRRRAVELEFGLDWFDAKEEFEQLVASAQRKLRPQMSDNQLHQAAAELIREMGAYPDKTIIAEYKKSPTLQKLPDYVVSKGIEQVL